MTPQPIKVPFWESQKWDFVKTELRACTECGKKFRQIICTTVPYFSESLSLCFECAAHEREEYGR